jgi:multidrug resistance efflux pump
MVHFLPSSLLVRRAFTIAIWLLAAGAAYYLHRESAGGAQASGAAEAREFTVSTVETGRLASVEVIPGQRVSRGQVLARLETGSLEQEIAVAEAEMRELEARVPAEARTLQLSGLEAERAFQREIEEAQVSIETARAGFARDRAELAGVRGELARQRDLVARHIADSSRIPDLEVRLAALDQAVATWPARVEALVKQQEAARGRMEAWRSSQSGVSGGEASREQVRPLELRVARQREYLSLLRKRASGSSLLAPVDARVATILTRQGTVLRPGDPVLVMVAEAEQVIAYADEERGYHIAVGDSASIRPRDRTGALVEGTVTSIAGSVAQIPVRFWPAPNRPRWGREVYIRIEGGLDPGQAVDITFTASRRTS